LSRYTVNTFGWTVTKIVFVFVNRSEGISVTADPLCSYADFWSRIVCDGWEKVRFRVHTYRVLQKSGNGFKLQLYLSKPGLNPLKTWFLREKPAKMSSKHGFR
jgi:hypothetical protein